MTDDHDISRRDFLVSAAGAAAALTLSASAQSPVPAHPSLNRADIQRMMTELSNWGRWGKDDQIGTVNLITTAKRKQALALAREATVVSLSHAQSTEKSLDNTQALLHPMNISAEAALDSYTMNYHGNYYSHMDALCHMFWEGHTYDGNPASIVTPDRGATKLDIAAFHQGIITRGVLLDIPRVKGVPYLEPGQPIYPEDLDAAEKLAQTKLTSGDALLLRTGRWARRAEKGSWSTAAQSAGLYATSVPWLKHRDISVLTSDSVSDVKPSQVDGVVNPIHKLVIVALGTPMFDNLDFEELSTTCALLNRWDFMFTAAPMVIPGGTGSPLNPLAVF